jgi:hypothetical protein
MSNSALSEAAESTSQVKDVPDQIGSRFVDPWKAVPTTRQRLPAGMAELLTG